ncbi:sporulation initiation factor Spo0A C-terminal domain-containing protein [Blautia schinkii]|nr:sporulation initiation factor Spo0A C-terminal domain-containing protein [Blautia schinkii]
MVLKDVLSVIWSIAGHPCNKSYYHLALVVYYSCQVEFYAYFSLERQIYPLVANETGVSTKAISRNVARAADDCWDYGDRKRLESIAGRTLFEKPTPKELIFYLCAFLTGTRD